MKKPKVLETKSRPVLVTSTKFNKKYFPSVNEKLRYTGMEMIEPKIPEVASASAQLKTYGGISVNEEIRLTEATQAPHTDGDHQLFEASARRNWAVRASLSVKEHFIFGYGSELVVELAESEKVGLTDEEVEKKIKELTTVHADIIKKAYDRDTDLKLTTHLKTYWWQKKIHGRGLIIKWFDNDKQDLKKSNNEISSLKPINSRRLGQPVFDVDRNMNFEGVVVDGQGLSRKSMIYGTSQDVQLSPNTEGYGYSELESIVHIAEELNIAVEEDFKEILKSAWLASILFVINTAGLTEVQARAKISAIVDGIEPAKFIGINEDIQDFKQLDLKPDYNGLVQLVDNLETKIYKALNVPQFLVQSESIANRATAVMSGTLFINGTITNDQTDLSDELQDQYYDPFVEKELGLKKNLKQTIKRKNKTFDFNDKSKQLLKGDIMKKDTDGFTEEGETKFRLRRIFNQAKIADFIDLADALSKLHAVGIWDTQKVNEELGTEDVTPRVLAEKEQAKKDMEANMNNSPFPNQGNGSDKEELDPKSKLKKNIKDDSTNLKPASASLDPADLAKHKAGVFKFLFEKVNEANIKHSH